MGKTSFWVAWMEGRTWLAPMRNDVHRAYCKICLKSFKIDGSGLSQVKSHEKSHKPGSVDQFSSQRMLVVGSSSSELAMTPRRPLILSPEDQILNAEILQCLHSAECNYSFASGKSDGKRFRLMFPDSEIAKKYEQGDTKIKHNIQFGIAPYLKEKLIYDVKNKPFTFKFDETTTRQVKKQYDGYLRYVSPTFKQVTNLYCGSLFVGHCGSEQLLEHFQHFVKDLSLDCKLLLHVGMDGPNVNKSFHQKLVHHLKEDVDTTVLDLGTCSLHPVHTAFRKGISELTYDIDGFLEDLYFFFKYSSARKKDFLAIQDLTNVTAQFLKQPAETRWIAIKYVAVRVLDQYPNIKEYFLKFLPEEKNFRSTFEKTDRYKRICKYLNDPLVEAALSFCGYIANDFEEFLKPFQSNEPKIHLMYPAMCQLVVNIMHKFVSRKVLSGDAAKNIAIDVEKAKNLKPVKLIDVGTKGKQLLSDPTFSKADQTKFRNGCMNFYKKSTKYLVDHLPLNRPILQYAQYLHPEKRNAHGATNAISNLAFKVASVMKGRHSSVFDLPASTTVDEVCDKVRDQWLRYH